MTILDRAIAFAAKAHDKQYRKATNVPYIAHPFSVGMILMQAGVGEDLVAAGVLHDVVEDTEATMEDLIREFGQAIADIVAGCSEPDKSLSWEERKAHTIGYLKTAPSEVKVVTAADKLHNIRSIQEDYLRLGEAIWSRFNRGKEKQAWYYTEIVKSLSEGISREIIGFAIIEELDKRVKELFM
ncbi:MAG: HD domain-containing protein [Tuberibacillus sp.]